jgi:NTE family protein
MSAAIDDAAATGRRPVLVDLALQGGGSHGAFTWGVLDRLLEEPWIKIEAISGTSAGAMNAAVLVDGWSRGGADGAQAALDTYWRRVSRAAAFSPLQRSPVERLMGRWTLDTSPAYLAIDLMSRVFSPYDLNPMGFNPLRQILTESIDFERLAASPIKLFITATNVHTGRGRIFRNGQITPDVLLASACLPTMFQAVEIDGEAYWDGGFAGNPTITPLVRESDAHDTILVQINPRERLNTPRTAGDILDRLNEISFNSPLMKELRMIALLRQAADPGHGEGARWAGMRTHRIMTDKLAEFGASSKLNAEWEFLAMLKELGPQERRRFPDPLRSRSRHQVEHRSRCSADGLLRA